MYKGLLLSVNNRSKYFDWENIDIITDHPELYYLDLTGDDKKELVIKLSKGHGTGASSDSIHIIDPINFSEYKIENPLKTIKNNVETTIFPKKQEAEIKINNNISKVDLEKKKTDFTGFIFRDYISYEIFGNKLKCAIGLDINTDDYVGTLGTINIQYSFKNNKFIPNNISFEY